MKIDITIEEAIKLYDSGFRDIVLKGFNYKEILFERFSPYTLLRINTNTDYDYLIRYIGARKNEVGIACFAVLKGNEIKKFDYDVNVLAFPDGIEIKSVKIANTSEIIAHNKICDDLFIKFDNNSHKYVKDYRLIRFNRRESSYIALATKLNDKTYHCKFIIDDYNVVSYNTNVSSNSCTEIKTPAERDLVFNHLGRFYLNKLIEKANKMQA